MTRCFKPSKRTFSKAKYVRYALNISFRPAMISYTFCTYPVISIARV